MSGGTHQMSVGMLDPYVVQKTISKKVSNEASKVSYLFLRNKLMEMFLVKKNLFNEKCAKLPRAAFFTGYF